MEMGHWKYVALTANKNGIIVELETLEGEEEKQNRTSSIG